MFKLVHIAAPASALVLVLGCQAEIEMAPSALDLTCNNEQSFLDLQVQQGGLSYHAGILGKPGTNSQSTIATVRRYQDGWSYYTAEQAGRSQRFHVTTGRVSHSELIDGVEGTSSVFLCTRSVKGLAG
ncbi:hypothetical protein [Ferrimonas marina]|uniref:Membrane-bound lysozyme-inhibitor of c-type lysozyme n=1 Tax=Ferrimonas marina TaxID=299255 RepID=A0A1M5MUX6_9GAMM|nr:hypothetical protein [Ferrimonas marina]SHG81081.1 hypothetical protein SAMN02745129_0790 [Ferrimonas marina]